MALGASYATLADLKGRLDIQDSVDDGRLTDALAEASVGIEKWCRRQFNDAEAVSPRTYYPTRARLAIVDDFSTTAGLVVKTDEDDDGIFETTWTVTVDLQLEPLDGIRDGQPGWPFWKIRAVGSRVFPLLGERASVQVTAKWGWAAVPARVRGACLVTAEEIFKLKDVPFGAAGIGDLGIIRIRENSAVQGMLVSYRLTSVRVA